MIRWIRRLSFIIRAVLSTCKRVHVELRDNQIHACTCICYFRISQKDCFWMNSKRISRLKMRKVTVPSISRMPGFPKNWIRDLHVQKDYFEHYLEIVENDSETIQLIYMYGGPSMPSLTFDWFRKRCPVKTPSKSSLVYSKWRSYSVQNEMGMQTSSWLSYNTNTS